MHLYEIAILIVSYYYAYRNMDHPIHVNHAIKHVMRTLQYNMDLRFRTFHTIDNIEIFDFPFTKTYLMNNDGDFPFDEIQHELIQYAYKHHHIINHHDIILFINVVKIDGLDITHEDIMQMLDPYYM